MSLVCGLSNEAPEVPCLNKVSGFVYERRLLEKYIKEHGKDPKSGQDTTEDDLINIQTKTFVKPRVPTATSLPSLIKLLQDEYDSTMMETFTLRKQLETTRQELSHSLYQHDAACRVIARLTKERDAARNALASVAQQQQQQQQQIQQHYAQEENGMEVDAAEEKGLPVDIVAKMATNNEILQSERKGRKKPADLATKEEIANYKEIANFHTMHSASTPGVLSFAVHGTNGNLLLTGGSDKKAVLFDMAADSIVTTFKGHSKKVSCVALHPSQDLAITGCADSQIRVFKNTEETSVFTFDAHTHAITSMSIHPIDEFIMASDASGKWGFHDIAAEKTYQMCEDPNKSAINCGAIHPDGVLYGCGTADNCVRIWDIRTAQPALALEDHTGAVNGLSFSGNGYYLATTAEDNTLRLWDLRKLINLKTVNLDASFGVSCVSFDPFGQYLAIGGAKDAKIYISRSLNEVATLGGHTKGITQIEFKPSARGLLTSSKDRSVRIWGQ